MIIEFFEITLGLITASLIFFLLYSFVGGSRKSQASKTTRNQSKEQFKEFEQEFGEEDEIYEDGDVAELSLEAGEFEADPLDKAIPEVEAAYEEDATEYEVVEEVYEDDVATAAEEETASAEEAKTRLISAFILANGNNVFSGYDLLQSLLASGLRFGEMNIFHRHEETNGSGPVLFSLASATEPGTFNIQNMGSFNGKGLCLFMQVKGNDKDGEVFELFIKTAQKLADELDGSIYDDSRHPLTKDSLNRYQRIIRAAKKESEPFELA